MLWLLGIAALFYVTNGGVNVYEKFLFSQHMLAHMALGNGALWDAVESTIALAPVAVVLGGGGYNPWTLARYWTGLWGRLSGRAIPPALPEAARTLLARLSCAGGDPERDHVLPGSGVPN